MRKPICATCGDEATVGSSCDDHWLRKQDLFKAESFTVIRCKRCNSWYNKKWNPPAQLNQALLQAVEENIYDKKEIEDIKIMIRRAGHYQATIKARGIIPPAKTVKEEEKVIRVVLSDKKCPECIKILGNYHEAIIQLRGDDVEKLADKVAKLVKGLDLKTEQKKEGYNLYVVRKGDARKVAVTLRKKGYEVKESYKLVGKKDGKHLWKDFYAIR